MKGVSLISDTILMIFLLAITIIMTLFVWALVMTFQLESKLMPGGMPTTRNVELSLFLKPNSYDSLMKALMEDEYQGIKIKRILEAAAIQGGTDIWLDGKNINVDSDVLNPILSSEISNDYVLSLNNIVISSKGEFASGSTPLEIEKASTDLFLLNGQTVTLKLLVAD